MGVIRFAINDVLAVGVFAVGFVGLSIVGYVDWIRERRGRA